MLYSPYLWQWATAEFRFGKLAFDLPYNAAWDAVAGDSSLPLAGCYTYLAHGAQSFVFQSEDRQWTLKIFRHDRWIHPWRKWFRNRILRRKKRLPYDRKINRVFAASKLAFERAADLTGLVYIHLSRTTGLPHIDLIGPLHRKWRIDLNRTYFVVQRKAEPIKQLLLESIHAGDKERFRTLCHHFIKLIYERVDRGIRNSDTKVSQNFGFCSDSAIEWDFGNYWIDLKMTTEMEQLNEIRRFTQQPEQWMVDFPEWLEDYRRELAHFSMCTDT